MANESRRTIRLDAASLASFDSDFGACVAHGLRWEKLASTKPVDLFAMPPRR